MEGEWIGFAAVVGPVLLVGLFFWLRYKSRKEMQDTFRQALDKGHDLSPELIDRLGHPKDPKDKDLRLGIIWLSMAAGLVLIAIAIPEPDAFRPILAGAAFPFTIGLGYMLLNKITDRD